jgi:predicted phosphoribosyltransferase
MSSYLNRAEAGKILAKHLQAYAERHDVIVLGLPRGGVPVAFEVAKALKAFLDVFVVRKLGVPGHEELALGALATGQVTVFNDEVIQEFAIPQSAINEVIAQEEKELQRRLVAYRGTKPFPDLANKIIILVDDGIATGATMRAAIKALRCFNPVAIVAAVPVAAKSACAAMAAIADAVVCPLQPVDFNAVGAWYQQFGQTTDEEVRDCLKLASNKH